MCAQGAVEVSLWTKRLLQRVSLFESHGTVLSSVKMIVMNEIEIHAWLEQTPISKHTQVTRKRPRHWDSSLGEDIERWTSRYYNQPASTVVGVTQRSALDKLANYLPSVFKGGVCSTLRYTRRVVSHTFSLFHSFG